MKKYFLFLVMCVAKSMGAQISYNAFPTGNQIFPRNLTTNKAVVIIDFTLNNYNPDSIFLQKSTDNNFISLKKLNYSIGG